MMREIRQSILDDTFLAYYHQRRQVLQVEDMDNPAVPPKVGKERRPRTLGNYEVHIAEEGFASIRQISSGEIMHSHTPPHGRSPAPLYVDQSDLAGQLALPEGKSPEEVPALIVWDIGLGAAANAMAAIRCYETEAAKGPVRRMRVISFENDL
jgi:queuine tRNA-ribosyltransferase